MRRKSEVTISIPKLKVVKERERECKYLVTNISTYVITFLGIVITFRHGE